MGQCARCEPASSRTLGLMSSVTESNKPTGRAAKINRQGNAGAGGRRAPAGLATRNAAVEVIAAVLVAHRPLDEALAMSHDLEPRDRAFARLIAATVIRRLGELEAVLNSFLSKPLPRKTGRLRQILLAASAQLLVLDTPAHAAINIAVEQCQADRDARHFAKLANAVLRRVAGEGRERLAGLDAVELNVPAWLLARWRSTYGEELARAIGAAQLTEAALDITPKSDGVGWAERLAGTLLPTGSIRLSAAGRIEELDGFADGAWWVQDAAAALPVRLLGPVGGLTVADLCAAPGGKTAQIAAAGARVTAVDVSAPRLQRVTENLDRLKLEAETVVADIAEWQPARMFDAILLDLPCSATGTIRRNPDILRLKRERDVVGLAKVQSTLIATAAALVRAGGALVVCVCSLEPEEGERQVEAFLSTHPAFSRNPVTPQEVGGRGDWITAAGDLRTLPCHDPLPAPVPGGMDGFYAARLLRSS